MTPTATATKSAQSPMSAEDVKRMLRDAAFVLHMTRRVKAQIVAERPEAAGSGKSGKNPELAAGLGV
jgi:hypothetical protein